MNQHKTGLNGRYQISLDAPQKFTNRLQGLFFVLWLRTSVQTKPHPPHEAFLWPSGSICSLRYRVSSSYWYWVSVAISTFNKQTDVKFLSSPGNCNNNCVMWCFGDEAWRTLSPSLRLRNAPASSEQLHLHLHVHQRGEIRVIIMWAGVKTLICLEQKHQRPSPGLSCILPGCTFKGSVTKIHFKVDFSTVTIFQQNTIGLEPFSASDGFVYESENQKGRRKRDRRESRCCHSAL